MEGFGVPARAARRIGAALPFAELCVAALLLIAFAEAAAWKAL